MMGYLEYVGEKLETALTDEIPVRLAKYKDHGQFTSNAPALLGKQFGKAPAEIAEALIAQFHLLTADDAITDLDHVTYAAPGFLNFYLKETWRQDALRYVVETQDDSSPEQLAGLQNNPQASDFEIDFEIEYAYLRICNQLRLLGSLGYAVPDIQDARLELLIAPKEIALMETLAAAPFSSPQRLAVYIKKLAEDFQEFFNASPIRGESTELAGARLVLLQCCKIVMEACFSNILQDK